MSYNFKSIADVEVVAEPAESANVLIEENGVIKKAPKTAVGGAGGEADLVIALTMRLDSGSADDETTSVVIESGSLEAVAAALAEGRPPVVKCKRYYVTQDFNTSFPVAEGGVYDCNVYYYGGYIYFSFYTTWCAVRICMNINDPDYLHVWRLLIPASIIQVT